MSINSEKLQLASFVFEIDNKHSKSLIVIATLTKDENSKSWVCGYSGDEVGVLMISRAQFTEADHDPNFPAPFPGPIIPIAASLTFCVIIRFLICDNSVFAASADIVSIFTEFMNESLRSKQVWESGCMKRTVVWKGRLRICAGLCAPCVGGAGVHVMWYHPYRIQDCVWSVEMSRCAPSRAQCRQLCWAVVFLLFLRMSHWVGPLLRRIPYICPQKKPTITMVFLCEFLLMSD